MNHESVFTRLRRLAVKVEKETQVHQGRCNKPPSERAVNDSSVNKILNEMQYDVHKLKDEAKKELKRQEETESFRDILTACDNLLRIKQQQACTLKAHLIQYGYQPPIEEAKQAKKQPVPAEDKENDDMRADSLTEEDACTDKPLDHGSNTPPEKTDEPKVDLDRTPKEEDFGISVSRTKMFLSQGVPPSSQKAIASAVSGRRSPDFETTAVHQQSSSGQSWEDLTIHSSQGATNSAPVTSDYCPVAPAIAALARPESASPKSPNLTSWFLQGQNKPPTQPVMHQQVEGETCTPTSPDCQTTNMLSVMPQEPKRLVNAIDRPEPMEPEGCYTSNRNLTPEDPVCSRGGEYTGGPTVMFQLLQHPSAATPAHKPVPPHLAFLQDDGTPKTPELTMSIGNLTMQSKPQAFIAPQETTGYQHPGVVAQSSGSVYQHYSHHPPSLKNVDVLPEKRERSYRIIAPITSDEHKSLSSKVRSRISLEKMNEWIWLLDEYLASKPMDERHLSPDDVATLQLTHPWLKATLVYLVAYHRLEKLQNESGEVSYMPFMRRKLDFS